MGNQCINCSETIPDHQEFCSSCDKALNQMVDAKETAVTANLVDTKVNPLFQTRQFTGSTLGDDPDIIANRLHAEHEEGTIVFWRYILLFIIVMVLIVIVAN